MSGFEWFLLIALVIVVPLVVAVAVTLWTLEQANRRKQQNRGMAVAGVKRHATRSGDDGAATAEGLVTGRRKDADTDAGSANGSDGSGGGDG